jgi:hypothetical protein
VDDGVAVRTVVLLLALRRWALAATVFLLCSWVAIPTAARATFAIQEMRGEPKAFVIDGIPLQSSSARDPCGALTAVRLANSDVTTLPSAPATSSTPAGRCVRAS